MKQQTNARTCILDNRACPSPRTVRKKKTPTFATIVQQTFYIKNSLPIQEDLTVRKKCPTRLHRIKPPLQAHAPAWLWNKPPPFLTVE